MSGLIESEWSFKKIVDLHGLGVREMTLTKEAATVLMGNLDGLHNPLEFAGFKPNQFAKLCGISFFVESEASHG